MTGAEVGEGADSLQVCSSETTAPGNTHPPLFCFVFIFLPPPVLLVRYPLLPSTVSSFSFLTLSLSLVFIFLLFPLFSPLLLYSFQLIWPYFLLFCSYPSFMFPHLSVLILHFLSVASVSWVVSCLSHFFLSFFIPFHSLLHFFPLYLPSVFGYFTFSHFLFIVLSFLHSTILCLNTNLTFSYFVSPFIPFSSLCVLCLFPCSLVTSFLPSYPPWSSPWSSFPLSLMFLWQQRTDVFFLSHVTWVDSLRVTDFVQLSLFDATPSFSPCLSFLTYFPLQCFKTEKQ